MIPRLVAKIESEAPLQRLALLIDADNAQPSIIEGILMEVARFGEPTVKRIYGDFTKQQSSGWKKMLHQYAIKPVQQFSYTTGKNATDSSLIIDAMDLLYTRRFDGFCIVSSDSDFTGLATRIREEGLSVIGFGEQKTPEAFRNSCHHFIYTETLRPIKDSSTTTNINAKEIPSQPFPSEVIFKAIELTSDDSGWAHLGALGQRLTTIKPDFDPRLFGFKKLSDLIKSRTDLFDTELRQDQTGKNTHIYIRKKGN